MRIEINNVQEEVDDPELQRVVDLLEDDTTIVNVGVGSDGEHTLLQLCKWHAVEAIKRHLIHAGYTLESRKKIIDLV